MLFVNVVWFGDPDFALTSLTPSADFFPDLDVVEDIEMELNQALAFMFFQL
jgi:hypothetical protein